MWRFISLLASLSLSMSAAGASKYQRINEEVALQNISVEPVNGGINPAFGAYKISAQVMLGSNSCYAKGLLAHVQVERGLAGEQTVVAYRRGQQALDMACIEIYQPVMVDVSVTVRGESDTLVETVYIRHAEELGTVRPLADYLPATVDCEITTYCTREYMPTVCSLDGFTVEGANRCEALGQIKRFACLNQISFVDSAISCKAIPSM